MKLISYFILVKTFIMYQSSLVYLNPSSRTGLIVFLVAIAAGLVFVLEENIFIVKKSF